MSKREFEDVEIIAKTMESQNPTLVVGFPGIGLIGNIASRHIIDQLDMRQVGVMESDMFPPVAMLQEGIIRMPIRIYENPTHNLMVIVSDIAIPIQLSNKVGRKIVDWAQSLGAREIISIAGIETGSQQQRVFSAATTQEELDRVKDTTEVFQRGTVSGISGSVMTECATQDLPCLCLMGESTSQAPDPRAAAKVIEIIASLYDITVETEPLLEQAEQIEAQLQNLSEQVQQTSPEAPTTPQPGMYG